MFDGSGAGRMKEAKGYLARITSAYQRAYFAGLVVEKQGRGALQRGMGGAFAYTCLREAMEHYERANELKEPGNDEAILRWNCCVRTIQEHGLRPRQQTTEQLLE